MSSKTIKQVAMALLVLSAVGTPADALAKKVVSFTSTDGNYWKVGSQSLEAQGTSNFSVVSTGKEDRRTFKGWGTCFNELDYDAYSKISKDEQEKFNRRLFNPNGDLKMNVGRIAIGASDYARSWYSLDETTDNEPDFEMEHFTIERDLEAVIPSIRDAQKENPNMTFWGSPWSPPQWMKTNKHYAQRSDGSNGCPQNVAPFDNDQFIDDPQYYNAYCLYFDKTIQAYKEQGINITTLCYQNEAYSYTPYPGCAWTAKTTGKFLAQYLGPYMREHHPNVKIMFGTCNTNRYDVYETVLATEGISDYVDIIGLQWEAGQIINRLYSDYSEDYELWQTESECGSGTFDWNAAMHTFEVINNFMANGVTTYTYWNAILEGNGKSTWGWRQNALIQVNNGQPRYTPEYYAFKHYSHFITPGCVILNSSTADKAKILTARTPEGAIIVVLANSSGMSSNMTIDIDGEYLEVLLPGNSIRTYVIAEDDVMNDLLADEVKSVKENVDLDSERLALLENAGDNTESKINALAGALGSEDEVSSISKGGIVDPNFEQNGRNWTLNNIMNGGDLKFTSFAGRSCWNNWSKDFTSMDIHQTVVELPAGEYRLRALSMAGDTEISDQHAYVKIGDKTYVSPSKTFGGYPDRWETQTTETFTVKEGDTVVVGYASTSGGGAKGWFAVTGFELVRVVDGEETTFDVLSIGTTEPQIGNSYYLYDVTKGKYLQVGSNDKSGIVSQEPLLLVYPKDVPEASGYYSFTTSLRSDWWMKSGYFNNMYVWFDATSGNVEEAQWYLTPGDLGVRLDVGKYFRTAKDVLTRDENNKYYLYYNGSVMAFTSDVAEADEFLFVDETAYKEAMAAYLANGGAPAEKVDMGDYSPEAIRDAGVATPEAGVTYYLYDYSADAFLGRVKDGGEASSKSNTAAHKVTVTPTASEGADYFLLRNSEHKSGYLKSGHWNKWYVWFDGAADKAESHWYVTVREDGTCLLDLGKTDNASCGSLDRSDEVKLYLYLKDDNCFDFTTDASKAHRFVFITPDAYNALANVVVINENTRNLASSGVKRDIKVVRELTPDVLNAVSLPFGVSADEMSKIFGSDFEAWTLLGSEPVEGSDMHLLSLNETKEILPNVPVMVKPSSDAAWKNAYTFKSRAVNVPKVMAAELSDVTFTGVYEKTPLHAGDHFLQNGKLVKTESGDDAQVLPTHAYLRTDDGRTLVLSREDVVVGIESIDADASAEGKAYSILGLPVNDSYKGVVIINGRKYIRK